MKRNLPAIIGAFTMILLMFSCSTSSNVTSSRGIQKRKYNKGFFVEKNTKIGGQNQKNEAVDNAVLLGNTDAQINDKQIEGITVVEEVVAKGIKSLESLKTVEKPLVAENITIEKTTEVTELTIATKQKVHLKDRVSNGINKAKGFALKTKLRKAEKSFNNATGDDDMILLYYILAILVPVIAVGLVTNWDVRKVVINLLLCILCWVPGIIHAIITVNDNV